MTRTSLLRFSAALLALAPLPAAAQNLDRMANALTDTLQTAVDLLPSNVTNVRLGLGPVISPDYEGSNDYNVSPVPAVSLRYGNFLEVDNNEVKLTAFRRLFTTSTNTGNGSNLRVGPLISINFGRSAGDSPDLTGMGKVGTSLELGAFVAYNLANGSRARLRARHDVISGHGGGTLVADYTQVIMRGDRFVLGGIVQGTWATGHYMRSFFGVNAAQAAASGYPVYTPGAGFKDVNAGLNASYQIATQWSVVADVNYKRLLGGAADSPIVALKGSANQMNYSAFLVYTF